MIVNIRGCNGAGKSTIPLSMKKLDPEYEVIKLGVGKNGKPKNPGITVFHKLKWVAIGIYNDKTGGAETCGSNQDIRQTIEYALEHYPEYDIVLESVIISTIKSTYGALFKELEEQGHQVLVMTFLPPLEVCLERIQQRNGGKPINEVMVGDKWRMVASGIKYFKEAGLTSLKIDTSKCSKESMLKNFLKTVDKHRR